MSLMNENVLGLFYPIFVVVLIVFKIVLYSFTVF